MRPALLLLTILALPPCAPAMADLVVVTNIRSGVQRLSREEAINIFMGRYRQLPGGIPAQPVDQPVSREERGRFYQLLVNKELSDINAYWARLVFSGKTPPPYQARDFNDVLEWLAKNKGAVGYIDRQHVDARFRIVLELEP